MTDEFFGINQNQLDKEWIDQPRFYFQYAKAHADATDTYERSKATLEVVEAELDQKIRSHPEAHGIAKVTEGAITHVMTLHADYQKAHSAMLDAKHDMDVSKAAEWAANARKNALENLVRLHGQQYFSTPQAAPEQKMQMDDAKSKAAFGGPKKVVRA